MKNQYVVLTGGKNNAGDYLIKHRVRELLTALRPDRVFGLLGSFDIAALASEEPARKNARRSLVASRDIPKGKTIDRQDLTWKRPAHGVSPKDIDIVVGKSASRDIKEDDVIKKDMFL